jgi:hypothetical protein
LSANIKTSGVWTQALVVDSASGSILHGHEQYHAAQLLGMKRIPAIYIAHDKMPLDNSDNPLSEIVEKKQIITSSEDNSAQIHKYIKSAHPKLECNYKLDNLTTINESKNTKTYFRETLHKNKLTILSKFFKEFMHILPSNSFPSYHNITTNLEKIIPNLQLRQTLLQDPSITALLPSVRIIINISTDCPFPFHINSSELRLPSIWLENKEALCVITRWGLEADTILKSKTNNNTHLYSVLRYATMLIRSASPNAKKFISGLLAKHNSLGLIFEKDLSFSKSILRWQASLVENAEYFDTPQISSDSELQYPLEEILTCGGDSRIVIDKQSGFNTYGIPPRPRPEAVQFSSTTASAISDHGFLFDEILRKILLLRLISGDESIVDLHRKVTKGIEKEIKQILDVKESDVVITASGTDAELISTMISASGANGRKVINILIAPNETGRGYLNAAEGRYFDHETATGMHVEKSQKAWPDSSIEIKHVEIRDKEGNPRKLEDICSDFINFGKSAIDNGYHVIAHILLSSKTGLNAPSIETVDELVSYSRQHVDVVVDACQVRNSMTFLGKLVSKGWMLQITGSKFLTGPPFSGALVMPTTYRTRISGIVQRLAYAHGVTRRENWSQWWFERIPSPKALPPVSFGPVFRWLPALMEAHLLKLIPRSTRIKMASDFRQALIKRIQRSSYLELIEPSTHNIYSAENNDLEQLSIFSFRVKGKLDKDKLSLLNEKECRTLFTLLNMNITSKLNGLSTRDKMLVSHCYHVGQPVNLMTSTGEVTILRFALGARFYNIVGHSGTDHFRSALESQIIDAATAIDKLEVLCENSWQLFD